LFDEVLGGPGGDEEEFLGGFGKDPDVGIAAEVNGPKCRGDPLLG
jgi:hypothetical protein